MQDVGLPREIEVPREIQRDRGATYLVKKVLFRDRGATYLVKNRELRKRRAGVKEPDDAPAMTARASAAMSNADLVANTTAANVE